MRGRVRKTRIVIRRGISVAGRRAAKKEKKLLDEAEQPTQEESRENLDDTLSRMLRREPRRAATEVEHGSNTRRLVL